MMAVDEYLCLPVFTDPVRPWRFDDDPKWPESRRRAWSARHQWFEESNGVE